MDPQIDPISPTFEYDFSFVTGLAYTGHNYRADKNTISILSGIHVTYVYGKGMVKVAAGKGLR